MNETEQAKKKAVRGSGGSEGGIGEFLIGLCLAGTAVYFFFDSVRMSTGGAGLMSRAFGGFRGGHWETTSMGIVFVPFAIGVFSLFVNAERKWAWWLTWMGLAIIAIEVLSRIRFLMEMKTSHFLIMLIAFLCGAGMMFKSYRDHGSSFSASDGEDRGS